MEITTDNSLFEIVQELKLLDTGMKDASVETMAALGEVIRTKVDRCVLFMQDVEARIQRHKDFEAEHKAARQYLEGSLQRFNDYVVYTMQVGGFEKLAGEEFVFGTRRSEEIVPQRDATAGDAEMFPDLCKLKVSYQWDKAALKDAIKKGTLPDGMAGVKINHNLTRKVK
jgi:hypothetical protein